MFTRGESDEAISGRLIRWTRSAVTRRRLGMGLSRSRVWPSDENARLRGMFEQGLRDDEIATIMGKTQRAVTVRRNRMGLTRYSRNTRPVRRDSAAVVTTLREGLDLVISMLRAHRTSSMYSIAEIEQEAQDALTHSLSRRVSRL